MADEQQVTITRRAIEERALGMAEAFAVENEGFAELKADPARWLAFLHGCRFGAMAAIEELRLAAGTQGGAS